MKIEMRGKSAYISGYVNAVERAETGVFSRALERAVNTSFGSKT